LRWRASLLVATVRTDGRTIFAEIVDQAGEPQLLDLVKSQFAFQRVIGPSLYAGVEFANRDMPVHWWLLGRQSPIVIDPARNFGQPIVSTGGIGQLSSPMRSRPRVRLRKSRGCSDCRRDLSMRLCGSSSGLPRGSRLEGLHRQQPFALPRPRAERST
jgi:hypothetical protein